MIAQRIHQFGERFTLCIDRSSLRALFNMTRQNDRYIQVRYTRLIIFIYHIIRGMSLIEHSIVIHVACQCLLQVQYTVSTKRSIRGDVEYLSIVNSSHSALYITNCAVGNHYSDIISVISAHGVYNHRQMDYLFNSMCMRRANATPKLCIRHKGEGHPSVTHLIKGQSCGKRFEIMTTPWYLCTPMASQVSGHRQVITSLSILWEVFTYPPSRYRRLCTAVYEI